MKLHLLAFLERTPRIALRGIGGPARFVRVASGLVAAVEPRRHPAPADERALLAHDAAVRRLCDVADAVLPARFSAPLEDEHALRAAVAGRIEEIAGTLERVRGREQMSLRVLPSPSRAARRARKTGTNAGRRFLEERREALLVPALDPVRLALGALIRDERVDVRENSRFVATVHHLVDRGAAPRYRTRVEAALVSAPALRLLMSGPFPPYAFATPGDVA